MELFLLFGWRLEAGQAETELRVDSVRYEKYILLPGMTST